jgi:hypothetical protein
MEALATVAKGKRGALVLGVQGKDAAEMLEYAHRAEALEPDAMIAMPPSAAHSVDDYREYFRALARVTKRPEIVQTSGGARNLIPSTDLIIELAREFPHVAYVKEESDPLVERMKAEIQARPAMKGFFGASLGTGWLYELRLGLDGIITGMGMYPDLMARIWDAHEHGRHDEVRDALQQVPADAEPERVGSRHRSIHHEKARRVQDHRAADERPHGERACEADRVQAFSHGRRGDRIPVRGAQAVSDAVAFSGLGARDLPCHGWFVDWVHEDAPPAGITASR